MVHTEHVCMYIMLGNNIKMQAKIENMFTISSREIFLFLEANHGHITGKKCEKCSEHYYNAYM